MYVVRDIVHCHPGKVRLMVEKFRSISTVMQEMGHETPRLLTDAAGDRFWTVVIEAKVAKIEDFFVMEQSIMAHESIRKVMADYHDLVDSGRREIYRIEG